ncbi:unnamed protein product [Dibothriocephalus latus]|uniref:Uncharacterized protein n=1 Tax=Dibothriocephalus latus TaxID=60516 RepID=A0A3P6QJW1_DIBLA|nr:unnamed protein product [Dibothriocephalus latus]
MVDNLPAVATNELILLACARLESHMTATLDACTTALTPSSPVMDQTVYQATTMSARILDLFICVRQSVYRILTVTKPSPASPNPTLKLPTKMPEWAGIE